MGKKVLIQLLINVNAAKIVLAIEMSDAFGNYSEFVLIFENEGF